jgi:adenylate cyclase, class 2
LKLREEAGVVAQLVAYQRPDRAEGRESLYRLVEIAAAEELKAALSDTLGIEAVVAKERRLFVWDGVRIHLDEVEGLGSFIEFEAPVAAAADLIAEQERVATLREKFGIADADLIGGSYCDLAADRPPAEVGPHGD